MSHHLRKFFSVICIGVLASACVQTQPERGTANLYDPSGSQARIIQAWEQFNAKYDNRWRVKWNPITRTPQRINGHALAITEKLTRDNIEAVTRKLLLKHQAFLQADPETLNLHKADFYAPRRPATSAGTWYVYFHQQHRGVSVYGGAVRLIIRNQNVTSLGSDFYPEIDVSTKPQITLADATLTAQSDLKLNKEFAAVGSKLLVFPKAVSGKIQYHLAWQVTMPVTALQKELMQPPKSSQPNTQKIADVVPVMWQYYVDAHTGEIIDRVNVLLTADVGGTVLGTVYPQRPDDVLEQRPISNMSIILKQGGISFPTETNGNGIYNFPGLSAGTADIEAHLKGPHVEIYNEETDDPDATHTATIPVPSPGPYDWIWGVDAPLPNIAEINAFYHVNWIRDWFLQTDPQLGNVTPDPMPVKVRTTIVTIFTGETVCNAIAVPTGLQFGKGSPGQCQDFALCSDVIYHEYTHRVLETAYAKANNGEGIFLLSFDHGVSMHEGLADYFSSTVTDDPNFVEGCMPSSARNIDTPNKRFPEDWIDEGHGNGIIISGAIWDTRAVLGAPYVDELALRAATNNYPTSFEEYLGAVLAEDDDPTFSADPLADNNPDNGTPNGVAICHAFFDLHGIYHLGCANFTGQPVAKITDPSPISSVNLYGSTVSLIPIIGAAAGTTTSLLKEYVLEYAKESTPDQWVGFDSGTATVSGGLLGELDTGGLSDGGYFIRLITKTVDGTSATAMVFIIVDHALMSGWPQEANTLNSLKNKILYFVSPAIADLDPLYQGLEIVGLTWAKANLYVWHSDGTVAWSKSNVWSIASPAVGDLDGDGDLEIVIHTYTGDVRVFHHDGSEEAGLWPRSTSGSVQWSTPALADLDADGDLEIVVGSVDGQVRAFHHDGSDVVGWPVTIGGVIEASPAVGDLEGNGSLEIVIVSNDGSVHVLSADGKKFSAQWPKTLPGTMTHTSSPVSGNLDDDSDMEIVAGLGEKTDFQIFAWKLDGTLLPGWPKLILDSFIEPPGDSVLANLDGDSALEVLVRSKNGDIHVWNGDGTQVANWPPINPNISATLGINSSPAVADFDADGDMEIVADAGSSPINGITRYKIAAFHHTGGPVTGWPKDIFNIYSSTAAIADIDLDGSAEIVIGAHGVFAWKQPGILTPSIGEWPFYRQNIRRTGTYYDTVPPVITLLAADNVTVEACEAYSVAKATALDNFDGDLTDKIIVDYSDLKTTVPKEYPITYDVSDKAGNAAIQVVQTVKVEDTTPPKIVLFGPPEVTITLGSTYKDFGAIAKDCVDGDIEIPNVGSDLDVYTVGTYIFTYFSVSDSSNNASAPASRTVHVVAP